MSQKMIAAQPSSQLVWDKRPAKTGDKTWPLYATIAFVIAFNAVAWTGIVAAVRAAL
jgi:hypothetical protein